MKILCEGGIEYVFKGLVIFIFQITMKYEISRQELHNEIENA